MHNHFVGGGGDFLSDDITSEGLCDSGLCDSDSDDAMQEVEEYFFELLVDMEIVTRLRSAYPTKIILAQVLLMREILRVWNLLYNHKMLEMSPCDETGNYVREY
uniref:Uncharacterized protein n=1 Tax=Haemonchus contortus TaxID=6289 RepID=A0A7I4Z722_HAECO